MRALLTVIIAFFCSEGQLKGQLSTTSQAIYDSCVVHTPGNVSYALSNGVQVISTPDSSSFYLQWFPSGATPNTTPIIVSLHGSKGNAFNEFKSWHTAAQSHNCGIIALQWYKYTTTDPIIGYFQDDSIYTYIDSALTRISYPSDKALLHGFSLGSARTYGVIYNDIQSGKNYFCTTISNAGQIVLNYPLYNFINTIPNVFAGKHWNLFCGPPEPPITGGACDGLDFTQTWLQSKGATVDIYIQDSLLGHDGFQQPTSVAYKDTMLNKYLECYFTTTAVGGNPEKLLKSGFYPNPFSTQSHFYSDQQVKNASMTVFNQFGQLLRVIKNFSGQTFILEREFLTPGLYFVRIIEDGKNNGTYKLIVED